MRNEKKTPLWLNIIWILLIVATVIIYTRAYLDYQTAQGVGLYFAIKNGNDKALTYNITAAAVRCLLLVILVFIGCLYSGVRKADSIFIRLSAFIGLMPQITFAYLIHLGDVEPYEGDLLLTLMNMRFLFIVWLPLLLILCITLFIQFKAYPGKSEGKLFLRDCFVIGGIIALVCLALLMPQYLELLYYIAGYLCYIELGRLFKLLDVRKPLGYFKLIPMAVLFMRAMYVLAKLSFKY